jgi:hypothetical protein
MVQIASSAAVGKKGQRLAIGRPARVAVALVAVSELAILAALERASQSDDRRPLVALS